MPSASSDFFFVELERGVSNCVGQGLNLRLLCLNLRRIHPIFRVIGRYSYTILPYNEGNPNITSQLFLLEFVQLEISILIDGMDRGGGGRERLIKDLKRKAHKVEYKFEM